MVWPAGTDSCLIDIYLFNDLTKMANNNQITFTASIFFSDELAKNKFCQGQILFKFIGSLKSPKKLYSSEEWVEVRFASQLTHFLSLVGFKPFDDATIRWGGRAIASSVIRKQQCQCICRFQWSLVMLIFLNCDC